MFLSAPWRCKRVVHESMRNEAILAIVIYVIRRYLTNEMACPSGKASPLSEGNFYEIGGISSLQAVEGVGFLGAKTRGVNLRFAPEIDVRVLQPSNAPNFPLPVTRSPVHFPVIQGTLVRLCQSC